MSMNGYKSLIFAVAALSVMTVSARNVSPDEALARINAQQENVVRSRAQASSNKDVKLTLKASYASAGIVDSEAAVYIFSPADNSSFVIAPADDAFPAVIGYGESSFDPSDMPPSMRYALDIMTRNIEASHSVTDDGESEALYAESWTAVPALIECRWNQHNPFNRYSPGASESASKPGLSGCVPTALAQVMYYHRWPQSSCSGKKTYTYRRPDGTTNTLSFDYDSYIIPWDKILPTYEEGKYTEEEADAVAKLVYACGVAVEAVYGDEETGAVFKKCVPALGEYFGFSKTMKMTYRNYVSEREFEELIYKSLANNMPVLFSGTNEAGGHTFVCDGYESDGFFHINWGWGDNCDGYYLLYLLNPDNKAFGQSGFNDSQNIITGVRPAAPGETDDYEPGYVSFNGDLVYDIFAEDQIETFQVVKDGAHDAFNNLTPFAIKAALALILVDENGVEKQLVDDIYTELLSGYGWPSFGYDGFGDEAPGTYKVYTAYKLEGATEAKRMFCANGYRDHIIITVDQNGNVTSRYPDSSETEYPDLIASSFDKDGDVYPNTPKVYDMSFTNESSEKDYYGKISFIVEDEHGNIVFIDKFRKDIPAGARIEISKEYAFDLTPGSYSVRFENVAGKAISGTFPLVIVEDPSSGVNSIESDTNTEPVYYNLQGIRVEKPTRGIYLMRSGNTVTKVVR